MLIVCVFQVRNPKELWPIVTVSGTLPHEIQPVVWCLYSGGEDSQRSCTGSGTSIVVVVMVRGAVGIVPFSQGTPMSCGFWCAPVLVPQSGKLPLPPPLPPSPLYQSAMASQCGASEGLRRLPPNMAPHLPLVTVITCISVCPPGGNWCAVKLKLFTYSRRLLGDRETGPAGGGGGRKKMGLASFAAAWVKESTRVERAGRQEDRKTCRQAGKQAD